MFADLLQRLSAPAPDRLSPTDARVALGALLVRLARSDNDYAPEEKRQIDAVLMARFQLSPDEAEALRAQCERLEAEAPDTVRFTRAIKDAVAYEDRLAVISAMWRIVLADGSRDPQEDRLMRMVAPLLGITDQDSHAERLRLEGRG